MKRENLRICEFIIDYEYKKFLDVNTELGDCIGLNKLHTQSKLVN